MVSVFGVWGSGAVRHRGTGAGSQGSTSPMTVGSTATHPHPTENRLCHLGVDGGLGSDERGREAGRAGWLVVKRV